MSMNCSESFIAKISRSIFLQIPAIGTVIASIFTGKRFIFFSFLKVLWTLLAKRIIPYERPAGIVSRRDFFVLVISGHPCPESSEHAAVSGQGCPDTTKRNISFFIFPVLLLSLARLLQVYLLGKEIIFSPSFISVVAVLAIRIIILNATRRDHSQAGFLFVRLQKHLSI